MKAEQRILTSILQSEPHSQFKTCLLSVTTLKCGDTVCDKLAGCYLCSVPEVVPPFDVLEQLPCLEWEGTELLFLLKLFFTCSHNGIIRGDTTVKMDYLQLHLGKSCNVFDERSSQKIKVLPYCPWAHLCFHQELGSLHHRLCQGASSPSMLRVTHQGELWFLFM